MKRIDILIWKSLMDELGAYVSSIEMCRELGLSRRQLLTRITKLRYPHVVKEEDGDRIMYFKLDCDAKEAQACTISLLSKYYCCSEDCLREVILAVPVDGTVTLDEIKQHAAPIFSTKDIINIMGIIPCIELIKTWSRNQYRRKELV